MIPSFFLLLVEGSCRSSASTNSASAGKQHTEKNRPTRRVERTTEVLIILELAIEGQYLVPAPLGIAQGRPGDDEGGGPFVASNFQASFLKQDRFSETRGCF
jgi:hypothetical protein